jgi:uncharacterized protein (DUF983 family)
MNELLKKNLESLRTFGRRSIRLQCPSCGMSSIVERPFQIRHHCPSCSSLFKREEGFFVGAILANVVTTELAILAVTFLALLVFDISYESVLWFLFPIAVIFPIAFYHHSWSLWLAFDNLVEGLPKYRGRRDM